MRAKPIDGLSKIVTVAKITRRDDLDVRGADERLFLLVELARAGQDDVLSLDRCGQASRIAPERTGQTGQDSDRHPGQNAAERCLRSVEITVSVDPDDADRGAPRRQPV